MLQRIMRVICLIIGISTLPNCSKQITKKATVNYCYKNESGYFLRLEAYNNSDLLITEYELEKADSVTVTFKSKGAGNEPFVYGSSVNDITDSLVFVFDNKHFNYFMQIDEEGPLNRASYQVIEDSKKTKTYLFLINKSHYEDSDKLNSINY